VPLVVWITLAGLAMLPEGIDELGNDLEVYGVLVVGFVLEQRLHWHRCRAGRVRQDRIGNAQVPPMAAPALGRTVALRPRRG
jgi:hypothetical protein